MRHRKKHKLPGKKDVRRKMQRSLAEALVLYEKIETTVARAKLTRSFVERLITKGKNPTLHAKRQIFSALPSPAARKVFEVLSPRYKERGGGYTRIRRLTSSKDGMPRARVEFV